MNRSALDGGILEIKVRRSFQLLGVEIGVTIPSRSVWFVIYSRFLFCILNLPCFYIFTTYYLDSIIPIHCISTTNLRAQRKRHTWPNLNPPLNLLLDDWSIPLQVSLTPQCHLRPLPQRLTLQMICTSQVGTLISFKNRLRNRACPRLLSFLDWSLGGLAPHWREAMDLG